MNDKQSNRLQILADELNSDVWEDMGPRGNPILSALTKADEPLRQLVAKWKAKCEAGGAYDRRGSRELWAKAKELEELILPEQL